MALERSTPLRPGVFWIDIWMPSPTAGRPAAGPGSVDGRPIMSRWFEQNVGKAEILKIEEKIGAASQPLRHWYLFQVKQTGTTPFPFRDLGFPTIQKLGAPDVIQPQDTNVTSDDTVTKPPPEPLFDTAPLIAGVVTAGLIIGGAILLPALLLRRK